MYWLYPVINPFHATGLFLYPLETSENLSLSDDFRGYRKRPVALNGLIEAATESVLPSVFL